MLRVALQKQKLFIGTGANVLRKRTVTLPEIRSGAMMHSRLKRLNAAVFFVVQSAMNGFVETAGCKVG